MQDNGWKVTSHTLHCGCLGHAGRAGAASLVVWPWRICADRSGPVAPGADAAAWR